MAFAILFGTALQRRDVKGDCVGWQLNAKRKEVSGKALAAGILTQRTDG